MKFIETKESFLSNWKEGTFYDSSVVTYRRKIDVFFEFLINRCGVNDSNFKEILRGIGSDKIVQSIDYYVKEYEIKFKVTVDSYFTVLKCYFDFISKTHALNNENFDSTIKFDDLRKKVDAKLHEMKLNNSEQKSPISKNAFYKLVLCCNEKIDLLTTVELLKDQKDNPKDYNKPLADFISAIIIKLVMLTAIKNQMVNTIKFKDYDSRLNRIKINEFWI